MLIYDEDTTRDDNKFKITKNTQRQFLAFSGEFHHSYAEQLESYLNDLGIEDMADHHKNPINMFEPDGFNGLEAADSCNSKRFEVTIILPKTFSGKTEAFDWFENKSKTSVHNMKNFIDEVITVDVDSVMAHVEEEKVIRQRKDDINNDIKNQFKELKEKLINTYGEDPEAQAIINHKFSRLIV